MATYLLYTLWLYIATDLTLRGHSHLFTDVVNHFLKRSDNTVQQQKKCVHIGLLKVHRKCLLNATFAFHSRKSEIFIFMHFLIVKKRLGMLLFVYESLVHRHGVTLTYYVRILPYNKKEGEQKVRSHHTRHCRYSRQKREEVEEEAVEQNFFSCRWDVREITSPPLLYFGGIKIRIRHFLTKICCGGMAKYGHRKEKERRKDEPFIFFSLFFP